MPKPSPSSPQPEYRNPDAGSTQQVMPVVEEQVAVQRETVETGRVRIGTVVEEHEELVEAPVWQEETVIERVAVNRVVEGPVPVRQEGDVTIVPVLEEQVVVQTRLVLKEELHVRRKKVEGTHRERVPLRSHRVEVQRLPPGGSEPEQGEIPNDPRNR